MKYFRLSVFKKYWIRDDTESLESSWTRLPLELAAGILSFLPAEDVTRLQLVCRHWRDLLRDPIFLALWSRNGARSLILFHSSEVFGRSFIYCVPSCYKFFPSLTTQKWYRRRERKASQPYQGKRLRQIPLSLKSFPKGSQMLVSHQGLLFCHVFTSNKYVIGNPLTRKWLQIPPMQPHLSTFSPTINLTTYFHDNRMFFKLWMDPYWFDSAVGTWTLRLHRSVWMRSDNTVCIGGVHYGLGVCRQFDAVVLLEIEDMVASSEARWIHAWNDCELEWKYVSMMDIGGEVGVVAANGQVLVLDRVSWKWKEISRMPEELRRRGRLRDYYQSCCTLGKLAFFTLGNAGVVTFDSQSLNWEWIAVKKARTRHISDHVAPLELNYTAEVNINTPCDDHMKKTCASRYSYSYACYYNGLDGGRLFEELKTSYQSGMSWAEIGATAVDHKWGFLKTMIRS